VRVGGHTERRIDARVVAATNRELAREVDAAKFRQDLLFRLNVHVIRVPALRERPADVPLLVQHFLAATAKRFGTRPKTITPAALGLLDAYDWRRNNVRELRNVVERLVIASDGDEIDADVVPREIHEARHAAESDGVSLRAKKDEAERAILLEALERNEWHLTNTARELGLADHASLSKILKRLGIRRP